MIWLTEIVAIDNRTNDMNRFVGERIEAPSIELAQQWCNEYKPYLKVIGRLSLEIDLQTGQEIDYDIPYNN